MSRRASVLAALIVLLISFARPDVTSSSAAGFSRYAVVIVIDGLNVKDLQLAPMPNLQALARRGVTYTRAFVGQEIADTPPSHATIGTGVFPRDHGVQGFDWKDPVTGKMTRPTDLSTVQTGDLERVIRQSGAPTLAGAVKSRFPKGKVAAVSGHKCYAADAMGTWAADYILCSAIYHDRWVATAMGLHRPPPGAVNNPRWDVPIPNPNSGFAPAVEQWKLGEENHWTASYALWIFHRVQYPRLLMINFPETDVIGHFAQGPGALRTLMLGLDQEIGRIVQAYKQAGILQQTDFVITSDHGMTSVRPNLPYHELSQAVAADGDSAVTTEADTAAAISLTIPRQAADVAQGIKKAGGSVVDAAFYKTRTGHTWSYRLAASSQVVSEPLLRAYEYLADTIAGPAGPDVLAIYAPHLTTRDFGVGAYSWVAGHLGAQWDEQHIPLIIAGPGVRAGVLSIYPARLVDIAPTMAHLLGVDMSRTDGKVLEDALTRPSVAALKAQLHRGVWLASLVAALQRRSLGT